MAKKRAEAKVQQEKEQQQQQQQQAKKKRKDDSQQSATGQQDGKRARSSSNFLELAEATSVAIIVPFRDIHAAQKRAAHLKQFVPHMDKFLTQLCKNGTVSDYHIYIVEQSDDGRKFNRGKLLNIGFDCAKNHTAKVVSASGAKIQPPKHDVFIFHDVGTYFCSSPRRTNRRKSLNHSLHCLVVIIPNLLCPADLLPQDDLGKWYGLFPKRPLHIARVWDRYSNNPKYFGGVVSFSASDYKRINGVRWLVLCV